MKAIERERARELRKNGESIVYIARVLEVSKSSVSSWVRDIELSEEHIRRFEQNQRIARSKGSFANREKAEIRHQKHRDRGRFLAANSQSFQILCALYWGEGDKYGKDFAISNCDPSLLGLVVMIVKEQGRVEDLVLDIQHYEENGISENEIRSYWKNNIPELQDHQFGSVYRCKISRASQRKNIGKQKYGTAKIRMKQSRTFFFEIMGGIDYLKEGRLA